MRRDGEHILRKVLRADIPGKRKRTTENKMERRVSTRSEKYWTESGRGDGQGDVEKKDHQSYRRPYMMGKVRGKAETVCKSCENTSHQMPFMMKWNIFLHSTY